jgi:uncharacterized membrane protein YhfC
MIVTAPLAGLFEIALPIVLAIFILRRFKSGWKFVGIGAVIFIASQVVHIPMLQGINWLYTQKILPAPSESSRLLTQALILGLAAGFCEETGRLVGFKLIGKKNRKFGNILALGIGHGGVESVFVGVTVLSTFIAMLVYKNPTLAATVPGLPAQVQVYWGTSWDTALAGGVERISAIALHLACTVLVYQTFVHKNGLFYVAALLWHAIVDGVSVYLSGIGASVWTLEGVVGIIAVLSILIIYFLGRSTIRLEQETAAAVEASAVPLQTGEES